VRLTGESTKASVKCWPSNGTLHSGRAFSISEPAASAVIGAGAPPAGAAQSSSPPSGAGAHHQMFVSDYTVRALTSVTYLRVSRFLYQAARSATLLERAQVTSDNNRAGDNGRLSVDSVVDVDSSQLTSTVSSYRYSSIGSVVDANCAGGILSEPHQETNAVSTDPILDDADPSSYY
jgi:hypothetical protein